MYAIIYNSEDPLVMGDKTIVKNTLLGYTEFPEDLSFKDKPFAFIEVESYDLEPLKHVWNSEERTWESIQ